MDLTTIISEADTRVPNNFDTAQKVAWLNEIHNEFFDVVKIPKVATFNTVAAAPTVVVTPTDIRGKNIETVFIGKGLYPSFQYDKVDPGRGYHTFDDTTRTITIVPTPTAVQAGVIKYYQINTTTFISTTLTAVPDAPLEYHWIFILGLCERIAKSMDDVIRANNYASDYRANLQIAQQNYRQSGKGAGE